jgi:C-terminal processing protease CtpA/Prc
VPIKADKGAFSSGEITGNAGNMLFRHFVLYLDYKHEKVIVEKGADFDKKFPEDGTGMQLIMSDSGDVEVLAVAEGTPAARLAIKAGDKLKLIDGKSPEQWGGILEVRKLFKAAPGTRYRLEFQRDGNFIKTEIRLKNLFS